MPDLTIQLEGIEEAFNVTVEPWGVPVGKVRAGERCSVVVHHPSITPQVTCSLVKGGLYISVYDAGSTFSFLREGVVEFSVPQQLAVPRLSSGK
jgi:hypothetical protein